jgi:ABC-type Fe3+/spermidine/putrescine transport system ATPase subunit
VPPERRNVGVVFQNYALWPHLTARATVAYPLRRAGLSRAASELAATELLQRLGIEALAERRPAELSGGEQQRVGLARALARNPALYLLDEPTAHLDTQLRAAFQAELRRRQLGSGAAAVCATHDPGEALAIADRIALIIAGRVVQTGTATEVYEQPVSVEAARLTGAVSVLRSPTSSDHQLLIRPEWTNTSAQFSGRIKAIWFRGPYTDYLIGMGIDDILVRRPGPPQHRCDEQLAWGLDRAWTVPVRPGRHPSAATAPG